MNLLFLLAQTTVPTSQPPPDWFVMLRQFGPLAVIAIVFFWLMSSSKRKQDKQRTNMLNNLKKGDRIQTIGGILGTVVEARPDEVLLKVDESSNTKIRFSRSAIHAVLEDEKAESK